MYVGLLSGAGRLLYSGRARSDARRRELAQNSRLSRNPKALRTHIVIRRFGPKTILYNGCGLVLSLRERT